MQQKQEIEQAKEREEKYRQIYDQILRLINNRLGLKHSAFLSFNAIMSNLQTVQSMISESAVKVESMTGSEADAISPLLRVPISPEKRDNSILEQSLVS